jgi:hypothetical protein
VLPGSTIQDCLLLNGGKRLAHPVEDASLPRERRERSANQPEEPARAGKAGNFARLWQPTHVNETDETKNQQTKPMWKNQDR